jgi:DNA-binding beta-propeller fold protein YncE
MRNELGLSLLVGVTLIVSGCSPGGQSEVTAPAAEQAGADEIPAFVFDPTWPKTPLPNNWMFGNIAGVHVDGLDQIWVLQRGNTVEFDLGDDYLARGWGDCCQPAPSVVVFDQDGNVVKAWGGPDPRNPQSKRTADGYDWPREHGIFVDHQGNVWIGCDEGVADRVSAPENCGSVTKFTNDGEVIWQKGRYGQSKGNMDTEAFNSPSGIFVDPTTNEAFVSDGYRNKRIAVIDADSGEFKRLWGPYGIPNPPDIPRDQLAGVGKPFYDPNAPPAKVFGDSVHCIELSRDGLVYVCDRGNNRIQVFQRDGTFVKEGIVKRETRGMGSVMDIAFSPDPQQRFLYVADGANHQVHILRRDDLEVLGSFGHGGRAGGEFGMTHTISSDSSGNLFVGETVNRNRIQKFRFVGMQPR